MKEPYLLAGKHPASPQLGGKSLAIQLQFSAHSLAFLGGAPQGVAGNPWAGLEGVGMPAGGKAPHDQFIHEFRITQLFIPPPK